jgi:hypothetical protein
MRSAVSDPWRTAEEFSSALYDLAGRLMWSVIVRLGRVRPYGTLGTGGRVSPSPTDTSHMLGISMPGKIGDWPGMHDLPVADLGPAVL